MTRRFAWAGPLVLLLAGACGGVTPIARSERAVVGVGLGLDYCMEPVSSAEGATSRMVLGYPEKGGAGPAYGVGPEAAGTREREIAEIMLFAREGMYRACEARQNGDLDEAQATKLRSEVMERANALIQSRNAYEVVALKARLVGEIAALDAQTSAGPCAPSDAACPTRRDELQRRKQLYESVLAGLDSPKK
jgi:hypothetical protein